MEGKQSVVIQGRTIHRNRPAERPDHPDSGVPVRRIAASPKDAGHESPYRLADLRDSRKRSGEERGIVRPRTHPALYGSSASSKSNRREGGWIASLMKRIAVAALIALVIFLLNSIRLPFAQTAVDQVKMAITHEFDLDKALGKLKFIGKSIPGKVRSVFQQDTKDSGSGTKDSKAREGNALKFRAPIQGEVTQVFKEQIPLSSSDGMYENKGIDITAADHAPFYATAAGVVAAVEKHELYGSSVWVDHGDQIFSFYGRCGKINVKAGQSVNVGEKLGTIGASSKAAQPMLHFEIWRKDKAVDPLNYIRHANQTSEQKGV
ncbi:M23 family metallopeptidase [Eubacteriales bacterium mix99]|jgi:murein DD-endopeptidase MepM/ murein hydrolase activator NlpD|nr:hypothetical protein [Clostridiales bacterium]